MLDHQSLRGEFINKRNLVKHLRGKFTNDMFHTNTLTLVVWRALTDRYIAEWQTRRRYNTESLIHSHSTL